MPKGEFLLEIRCEEIPARMLQPAVRELRTRLFEELMARNMGPREIQTGFTPRRLMVTIKGLPGREPDREEEVLGPPVDVAYGKDGKPSAALEGFARRCAVRPEDLRQVTTEKGKYLAAVRQSVGRSTPEVLAELVPAVLRDLSWPKTMVWGHGEGPWVRPVHGIVALFEGEVVPFELFGVASGATTCGHPRLSREAFQVTGAADYRRKLARCGIQISFEARRAALVAGMQERATALGGVLADDPELLDRLAAVCETPGLVEGALAPEFLTLPREVLVTSLRDHQSALTVESDGVLLPSFLTVMDRRDDPKGRVRAGNEWVVAARLADARFFYEEDRKVPLAERVRRLEHLTFHEKLGSYADKTARIVELAGHICTHLAWDDESESAREAAQLLKADLTTEMVREFTSLQGTMGGIYAREEGYPETVWQAIYDHYLPVTAQDPLPRGRLGMVVGLADRLDTLVGLFGLGVVPTGSRDQFGQRRLALGAVRIVLEGGLSADLELVAARAARLYGEVLPRSAEEILADLRPFLHDRVRHLLGQQGFAYDEIQAALAVSASDLPDLKARVEALHRRRGDRSFLQVVLAAKRIANILRDSEECEFSEELLVEPAERALYRAAERLKGEIEAAAESAAYDECVKRISRFARVLDRFFIEVLVMDEKQELKQNRIALLQSIDRILSRIGRLTEMVVDKKGDQKARVSG